MQPEEVLIKQRELKLQAIKDLNIEPYPYSYDQKNFAKEILEKFKKLKKEEKTKTKVSLAGRIVNLRMMGKASFGNIQDSTGKIQFYIREDQVNQKYKLFKNLDIGDIIGIKGTVFRTKLGEISIWITDIDLLAKSLKPMPEKWHGLQDTEIRYRQRYLDLIINPQVREIFVKRTKIIDAIREFMNKSGFLEVETPILQPIYGGANARPFKTNINALNMDIYLRISDELYLKKLIVGGFEKVYEFSKDFRNEGIDRTHNPEFLLMECYQAYVDYNTIAELTEDLYIYVAKKVLGKTKIDYQGEVIDLKKPWKRITMIDSIKQYANIDVTKLDDKQLQETLKKHNIELKTKFVRGLGIAALFEELVQSKIIQPTFILDHPKETTPLCKIKRGNNDLIERFEPIINGWEIGNAYSELNDPKVQRELLEQQARSLMQGDQEAHPMDEDFIKALEYAMPPTGGLGIGVDRMIMLLTNSQSIREVLLFPFMKKI